MLIELSLNLKLQCIKIKISHSIKLVHKYIVFYITLKRLLKSYASLKSFASFMLGLNTNCEESNEFETWRLPKIYLNKLVINPLNIL